MKRIFKNKVLDELFQIRSDGFEKPFIKQYGEPKVVKEAKRIDGKLNNLINRIVEDEKSRKKIFKVLEQLQNSMLGEMCFWEQQYYKLGFSDGMNLENIPIVYNEKLTIKKRESEMAFNEETDQFCKYIEEEKIYLALRDSQYKRMVYKIEEIKQENPKVQAFLKGEVIELSTEDCKDLQNIINLKHEMKKKEERAIYDRGAAGVVRLIKEQELYEEFERKRNEELKKKK